MPLGERSSATSTPRKAPEKQPVEEYGQIVWRNIIIFAYLHVAALYGLYLAVTGKLVIYTTLFFFLPYWYGGLGVTAGAHRLWCHRSYKGSFGLRVFLMIGNCIAIQNDIYEWSRDHRTHHKFSETHADPHNSNRGFFFAHMGWLLCRKHPDVKRKGQQIDMSDLQSDSVVMFQRKYYKYLAPFFGIIVPTVIPTMWNEPLSQAFFVTMLRYVVSLHQTWLVNSAAHTFGNRPYDKYIKPRESSLISWLTIGEGFHNYHHTFPQDYRASEYGFTVFSFTTFFINCCASLGLATNCTTISSEAIERRRLRTGEKQNTD